MSTPSRATTVLLGILTTIMVGWVLHVGAGILQPLVIALLLSSMLQPVVRRLARWHIPPPVTVIVISGLLFFGIARGGLILQANIVSFVGDSRQTAPSVQTAPGDLEGRDLDPSSERQRELIAELDGLDGVVEKIAKRLGAGPLSESLRPDLVSMLKNLASDFIGSSLGFTRGLLLVTIYMLFIFAEAAVFRRKIFSIAGERQSDAKRVLDRIGKGIQRYIAVKTTVSLLTGAICYVALVALDIPYALLFGLLTFLLNYIPTFGSIIAGSFPTFTALAIESPSWNKAIAVAVVYLSVNVALGSFLEPKILGRELNLSPLVIIISVVVWAGIWGVVGTFLAVPLTAAMQIIFASNETTRPIAIMLSSGPPRDERRKRRKAAA